MDMNMKYFLSALWSHIALKFIGSGESFFCCYFFCYLKEISYKFSIISRNIIHRWNLFFGDNQNMCLCFGSNIMNRNDSFVFIHERCWNLTINNFGKYRCHTEYLVIEVWARCLGIYFYTFWYIFQCENKDKTQNRK